MKVPDAPQIAGTASVYELSARLQVWAIELQAALDGKFDGDNLDPSFLGGGSLPKNGERSGGVGGIPPSGSGTKSWGGGGGGFAFTGGDEVLPPIAYIPTLTSSQRAYIDQIMDSAQPPVTAGLRLTVDASRGYPYGVVGIVDKNDPLHRQVGSLIPGDANGTSTPDFTVQANYGVLWLLGGGNTLEVLSGKVSTPGQIESTISTGTAPLVVSSTTKVDNLNADFLDGHDTSYFQVALSDAANIVYKDTDNAYTAGKKQTVTADATYAGLNVGAVSADPSSLSDGDLWGTTGRLKMRINGTTETFEVISKKNAASGYAGLDSGSRIAKAQGHSATVYTDAANAFTALNSVKAGSASSLQANIGGVIKALATSLGNVGTGEDDLHSYTVPANTWGSDGDTIEFYASGTFSGVGTANKRLRYYLDGTLIFDTGAIGFSATTDWRAEGQIIRSGSGTLKATVGLTTSSATLSAYAKYTSLSKTLTDPLILKATGETSGVGTADNDVVEEIFKVYWEPAGPA